MRLLLSDGSSLSSRQTAGLLHAAGHTVDTLGGRGFGFGALTRAVGVRHVVPRYADDPVAWLTEAVRIAKAGWYDVLVPTQEQTAALSAGANLVATAGIRTAVPPFASLRAVQDKATAAQTLCSLGIATPSTTVVGADELAAWDSFPIFAKRPIATGSTGVINAGSRADLPSLGQSEKLVMQEPVDGPLAMVQTVWCHGELVAAHANERVAEGAGGGASRKRSLACHDVIEPVARLGKALAWHGALSADVILSADGPLVIDVNPRLVEPANAAASGVDLLGALIAAAHDRPDHQPDSQPDVRTHQLALALVGAAQYGAGRRRIAWEAVQAITRRGSYRSSREELTPVHGGDWRSGLLIGVLFCSLLARPDSWQRFAEGTVSSYALTPEGWARLCSYR